MLKASDVLANELRATILEGDLQPGTPFPSETELIERHQFSRGTVREALRLLEAEDFISIQRGPKGGITVRHPDVDLVSGSLATLLTVAETPLKHLFAFRKLLEPAAATDVTLHASPMQRRMLRAATDPTTPERGSASFHKILCECVENELLRVMLSAINRIVEWQTGLERVADAEVERAGRAHQKIAMAIDKGDAEAASSLMLHHIEAYESVMRKQGRLEEPILPRDRWSARLRQGTRGG